MISNTEKGRSMVEILAVLAIMGVITLGGIWQYRQAMDRRIASDVIYTVRAVATTVSVQVSLSKNINLEEFERTMPIPYPISAMKVGEESFSIMISKVPEKICSYISETKWDFPHKKSVNGVTNGACNMSENLMVFDFDNTLDQSGH